MDMSIHKFTFIRKNIQNEKGIILPFLLTLLIFISIFITTTLQQIHLYKQYDELMTSFNEVQNLMTIAIDDFSRIKNDLEITDTRKHLTFRYELGDVEIDYFLNSQRKIQLYLKIITNTNQTYNFSHEI